MVFLKKRLLNTLMQICIMLRHLVVEISRFKFDDYRVIRTGASDLKLFWGGVYSWTISPTMSSHDDVIKWKHFPRYWPFVRGIHRSPVNSPHKGQWRGALMFTLICARINSRVNNREAGDLRRYSTHYDVIVMSSNISYENNTPQCQLRCKCKCFHKRNYS